MAKITIEDKYMDDEGLTEGAKSLLKEKMEEYLVMIVTQAGLSESRDRIGNGKPEITTVHISDAELMCRRGLRNNKISKRIIAFRTFQLIGSFIIGIGASNFTKTWGVALTVIGFMVGVLAYVFELEDVRKG